MRARALVAIMLGLVACKPTSKAVPDAEAPPRVGRLPIDIEIPPPEPSAGFTACHDFADPLVTVEGGQARIEHWRRARPAPPVHPSDARASMAGGTFKLEATSRASFAFGVEGTAAPAAIRSALKDSREFSSVEDDMLSALFPDPATVGWVAMPSHRDSPAYRVYALRERVATAQRLLETAGRAAVTNIACSFEEGSFHRDQYRVEESGGPERRLTFVIDAFYGDYSARSWIDLRLFDLGATSAVLACLYESRLQVEHCDRVARSFVEK